MLLFVFGGKSAPGPAINLSKMRLSSSATLKSSTKAASAASFTGMTRSLTLAKMGGASSGTCGRTISMFVLLRVREITNASRRESTGLPGSMILANVSNIFFVLSKLLGGDESSTLPVARMKLSAMNVYPYY